MRLALATALAVCLASQAAWGHTFPPVRTVVVQVERCEVVLLVGYRPGSGEPTEAILAQAATAPKSRALDTLRRVLTTYALGPLTLTVDGVPRVPTAVRAKIGVEPGGERPMIVVLVTYAVPAGGAVAIASTDARSTRFSWTDQHSGRVAISEAPAQGQWHAGVASFLLKLAPPSGGQTCAPPSRPLDSSDSSPASAR